MLKDKRKEKNMKVINEKLKIYSKNIKELTEYQLDEIKTKAGFDEFAIKYDGDTKAITLLEESKYFDILKDFIPNYIACHCVINYFIDTGLNCEFIKFIEELAKSFKYVP